MQPSQDRIERIIQERGLKRIKRKPKAAPKRKHKTDKEKAEEERRLKSAKVLQRMKNSAQRKPYALFRCPDCPGTDHKLDEAGNWCIRGTFWTPKERTIMRYIKSVKTPEAFDLFFRYIVQLKKDFGSELTLVHVMPENTIAQ